MNDTNVNKGNVEILRLQQEQAADRLRLVQLLAPRKSRMGRSSDPWRNLIMYQIASHARKTKRPKHPGLKPVQLSWDKCYEVVSEALSRKQEFIEYFVNGTLERVIPRAAVLTPAAAYGMNSSDLSVGAIRAAVANGKKIAELIDRIRERSDRISAQHEVSARKSIKKPAKKS